MKLSISIEFPRHLSLLAVLIFSPNIMAEDWVFKGKKNVSCTIHTDITNKATGNKIASIGMIKLNSNILNKLSGSESEVFLSDIGLILEPNKRHFQVEVGAGVQLFSESLNKYFNYMQSGQNGSKDFIYTLSSSDSLDVMNASNNQEEITLEFNTSSSEVVFGVVMSNNFEKSYKQYNQCIKTLG